MFNSRKKPVMLSPRNNDISGIETVSLKSTVENYSNAGLAITTTNKTAQLTVSVNSIIRVLAMLSIIFVLLSVIGQIYKYEFNSGEERYLTHMFNVDKEDNFPTYFSTLMLLLSSFLFFIIGMAKHELSDKYKFHWLGLSFFFFLMSMDEILQLHEQLSSPIRQTIHSSGFFYFAWTIPAIIALTVFAIAYLKFLLHLNSRFRKLFFLSGFIYIVGALVLELIAGKFISFYGQANLQYSLITTIEESLEMGGIIILIYSLLNYIKSEMSGIQIKFAGNIH